MAFGSGVNYRGEGSLSRRSVQDHRCWRYGQLNSRRRQSETISSEAATSQMFWFEFWDR